FGENFVDMNELKVNNVKFDRTTYGAGTDQAVELQDAGIGKISAAKVHVEFAMPAKEEEQAQKDNPDRAKKDQPKKDQPTISSLKVTELVFDNIRANKLKYDGHWSGGKDLHLEGETAWISRLRFPTIDYDRAKAELKFGIRVERTSSSAFGIKGI